MADFNACARLLGLEGAELAEEKAMVKDALAVLGEARVHRTYRWLRATLERAHARP